MKLKYLFTVLTVLLIASVFVIPVLAQGEVPPEPPKIEDFDLIEQGLILLATVAVTWGVKYASKTWGIDLEGKATQFTATITLMIFETANQFLAMLPPAWYVPTAAFLGFVGTLLAAFGVASYLNRLLPPKTEKPK